MNSSMRREERLIEDMAVIESFFKDASVCRLAMSADNQPYIVPMCFGYRDNTLYLHSAPEGLKMEYLRKNSRVCFEIDTCAELVTAEKPCSFGMKFKSVVGFGRASFIDKPDEKKQALDIIMDNYSDERFTFPEPAVEATAVIRVDIESVTGKQAGS